MEELKYKSNINTDDSNNKMIDFPILLLITDDVESPEIVSNIRKIPNDEEVHVYENSKLYIHDIKTKYYTTKIALHPTRNLESLPMIVKEKSEGILIHFNPYDRSFLETLPQYVNFIKENQIEFSIMLCKQLPENTEHGITFKCIKDCYNMLDIIELEKSPDDEENEGDIYNPTGFDELEQALRSVVWSNVDMNSATNKSQNDDQNSSDEEGEDLNVEDELHKFEKLLGQVMQFRPSSGDMTREDRLNCAQNFAEIFEKLILQDETVENLAKD